MAITYSDDVLWSNVVGTKTLVDGGAAGDLLELGSLHIEKAMDAGYITQGEGGSVYVQLIASSFEQAIAFELLRALRNLELEEKNKEIEMLTEQIESENLKQEQMDVELNTMKFNLEQIKPLEKSTMEEEIESINLSQEKENVLIDTASFDLNEIKPLEKTKIKEDIESINLEQEKENVLINIASFDLNKIKPLEKNQLEVGIETATIGTEKLVVETDSIRYDLTYKKPKEIEILSENVISAQKEHSLADAKILLTDKQSDKTVVETDLLSYELGSIKPKELQILDENVGLAIANKELTQGKSLAEKIKNGLQVLGGTEDVSSSLYKKNIDIAGSQKLLVDRQTKGFEEEKDLRIFKTQVDYATMIFDQAEVADVLEIGKDLYITRLYNKMIRPDTDVALYGDVDADLPTDINQARTPNRISTKLDDLRPGGMATDEDKDVVS